MPCSRLIPRSLMAAALLLSTACTLTDPTPPIPGARLEVSEQNLTLRPGESARLLVELQGAPSAADYVLRTSGAWQGVQVSPAQVWLRPGERRAVRVSVQRDAPSSLQTLYLSVSDGQGRGLQKAVSIRVRAVPTQAAPVQLVPVQLVPVVPGQPVLLQPVPIQPVPIQPVPTPVQPAPVVPVPLP